MSATAQSESFLSFVWHFMRLFMIFRGGFGKPQRKQSDTEKKATLCALRVLCG
jgi:hypothetical protein